MYPVMLDGTALDALIVGGGDVAARKAEALIASGARVHLIGSRIGARCRVLAGHPRVTVEARALDRGDIAREIAAAMLVVAATDDPELNAAIAAEAKRLRRLVNVVDAPGAGNCITPATHRAGGLTIAVSAGGVPSAAVRIRDAIAERFDDRYAAALASLAQLRERLLGRDDRDDRDDRGDRDDRDDRDGGEGGERGAVHPAGNGRVAWKDAARTLVADDFCESVERSTFAERVAQWR